MAEYNTPEPDFYPPIMIDPAVQRSIDQMREFQAELNISPNASSVRIGEMIRMLDNNWMHMGEMTFISGNVHCPVVDVQDELTEFGDTRSTTMTMMRDDGEQDICTYFARDIEFTSRGFIAQTEPFVVGGLEIGTRTTLHLMFQRSVYVNLPGEEEKNPPAAISCILNSYVSPDEVTMEFTRDSFEYNRVRSLDYFPEFIAKVDEKIDDTLRIAEKIMALQGMEATINPEIISDIEVRALGAYLDELVHHEDDDVPFTLKLRAGSTVFDPDSRSDMIFNDEEVSFYMVRLQGVRMFTKIQVFDEGNRYKKLIDEDIIEPRLAVVLLGRDAVDDSPEVEIRVADIEMLQSSRQEFLAPPEDDDEDDETDLPQ